MRRHADAAASGAPILRAAGAPTNLPAILVSIPPILVQGAGGRDGGL